MRSVTGMTPPTHRVRIAADVGGTFTDVVLLDESGRVHAHKVPSTPPDFERAVGDAVDYLLQQTHIPGTSVDDVAHGTTVATNAVLERTGAHTALITTEGFRDVLELRRIHCPQLYNLFFDKPPQLVERERRFEVAERMSATGEILKPLDESGLPAIVDRLQADGVESVAVALLHSYAFPQHERLIGEYLKTRMPNLLISLSCDVLPERREYERTATTVVNAYIRPVMDRYVSALSERLEQLHVRAPLLIMQSAGGLTPAKDATNRPVFVLESGPAAGVLASRYAALELGIDNLITLDMGGTTAKASMIENGNVGYSAEYEVGATLSSGAGLMGGGGELIRAPSIDIAEVGAGGGSIAYLDSAGGLRVGPRSAGALPGPVCYGRGGSEPTLTDANVVLGFIRPGALADGEVQIDLEAARQVIDERIATPLGLELAAAAEGIHRIANARTLRALRSVSSERGRDPREFSLIAFGGSGPIHAAALGLELGVRQILIPPLPGLFSAIGLLCSGVEHHGVRSCLLSEERLCAEELESLRLEIETEMLAQFAAEGIAASEVALSCSVDVRFRGQTSEIRVSWPAGDPVDAVSTIQEGFEDEHERLYGHRSDPDNPVEVRAVRLIGTAANAGMQGTDGAGNQKSVSTTGSQRQVYFGQQDGYLSTPVIKRVDLDSPRRGPLLIDEFDTTIVIPPHAHAHVDGRGNLIMTLRGE